MYKEPNLKPKQGETASPISLYQPSEEVREATRLVTADYETGTTIQNTPRTEFNNRTLIEEIDANQKAFNSYVPPKSEDPDESWRAQTVRPITRNKLVSIAAHVTARTIYPGVFAQNDRDEEDRDAAEVMKDLMDYVIENSEYERVFIRAAITALVDPAVLVSVEFAEVMKTVKWMMDDGTWTKKEILDTVLSGFQFGVVPTQEILIANLREPNIQKQRFIIRSRDIEYADAELVYGRKEQFKYVKPGVRTVFFRDTNTFYDVEDENLKNTRVHEVRYWNRSKDLELVFLNGVLMCDPEYPMQRKDKLYPFAKGGYEPLGDGQFFYYKSAANKLGSDQEIVDTLYNMFLDGTFMSLMPVVANYGGEELNGSIYVPGSIVNLRDTNSRLEPLMPRADLRGGLEAMNKVEQSMAESSQDNMRAGVAQGGERTAREVLVLEQNAKAQLGLFVSMMRFLVEDIGKLVMGDILQHMTVADIRGITTGEGEMKYRKYLLPDRVVDGKKVTKQLEFRDPTKFPEITSQEDLIAKSYEILDMEGGPDAKKKIYVINPETFRNNTYRVRIEPDILNPKSSALEKALDLELYDRAVQNPNVDQEMVTRDFLLGAYAKGDVDKYMKKKPAEPTVSSAAGADIAAGMGMGPAPEEGIAGSMRGTAIQQQGVNTNLVGQLTGKNSLGVAASSDMQ